MPKAPWENTFSAGIGDISSDLRYFNFLPKMSKFPTENADIWKFSEKVPNFRIKEKASKMILFVNSAHILQTKVETFL